MRYYTSAIRDQLLLELRNAPKGGRTGLWLAALVRKAGIRCATSGVYRALERLMEQGLVTRPKDTLTLDQKMEALCNAVGEGPDDLSKSTNIPFCGYSLTNTGVLAGYLVEIRRSKNKPSLVAKLTVLAERTLVECV
jgi:hypothetical protein